MHRVLSGITPSGSLTLGNHLGALRRFGAASTIPAASDGPGDPAEPADGGPGREGFYFVADLHALTTPHDAQRLRRLTRETAALFLSAGLEGPDSTVFVQSHVHAHVELGYLLESTAHVGELGRMIQFKEKGGRPGTRASLFTYPCLMAADILLYDADEVPVGGDQDQHVELCRDLALRFNHTYGETFVVPRPARAALASRVRDLGAPTTKMSKTAPADAAGVIRMLDRPDDIRRKLARATTDSEPTVDYDPEHRPGVANLLEILAVLTGRGPAEVATQYTGYGRLKSACADAVIAELEPIRQRCSVLLDDPAELDAMLARGAERAAKRADTVLARARGAIGLVPA